MRSADVTSTQDYYSFGMLMPGRRGAQVAGGWAQGGGSGSGVPQSLSVESRDAAVGEYKASQEITFEPGFGSSAGDAFLAEITQSSAGGSSSGGFSTAAGGYRYGFQGFEADNEIKGEGNSLSFGDFGYDSRMGKRWNKDPIQKVHESPFATFANNPIWFVDPTGKDTLLVHRRTMLPLKNFTRQGGDDVIFIAGNNGSWEGAKQLFYELNISGINGGTQSKEGDPVKWRWKDKDGKFKYLSDQTSRFSQLMFSWETHMKKKGKEIDATIVPESRYTHRIGYLWQVGTDGAPLDLKAFNKLNTQNSFHPGNIGEWSWFDGRLLRYDDYGNINFGRAAAALGIKTSHAIIGAEINQLWKDLKGFFGLENGTDGFGDEPRDKNMILWGSSMLKK